MSTQTTFDFTLVKPFRHVSRCLVLTSLDNLREKVNRIIDKKLSKRISISRMDAGQILRLDIALSRMIDRLTSPDLDYVLTKSERSNIDLFILMFGGDKRFNNLVEALELFTSMLDFIEQTLYKHQGE